MSLKAKGCAVTPVHLSPLSSHIPPYLILPSSISNTSLRTSSLVMPMHIATAQQGRDILSFSVLTDWTLHKDLNSKGLLPSKRHCTKCSSWNMPSVYHTLAPQTLNEWATPGTTHPCIPQQLFTVCPPQATLPLNPPLPYVQLSEVRENTNDYFKDLNRCQEAESGLGSHTQVKILIQTLLAVWLQGHRSLPQCSHT